MTRPRDEHLGSCDLSDACDRLGAAAVRTGAFRPLWPECPPVDGLVTTVRLEPSPPDASPRSESPLEELLAVLEQAAGGLVVVDLAGRDDVQCWGSVLATAAARYGVRGALIHGAARDLDGLQRLGFPTYARGVHPAGMRGRLRLAAIGEAVDVDGGRIEAGCFAAADSSGAVFVQADRLGEIRAVAADLRRSEELRLDAIRVGADPRTTFGDPAPGSEPAAS